jgi:hypothetical protein
MKVLIVGLGAVGAVYAYHLEKGGAEVHALVKDTYYSHLQTHPLRLHRVVPRLFGGRQKTSTISFLIPHERLHTLTKPASIPTDIDTILICTSAEAIRTGTWIKTLADLLPKAALIFFTPGPTDLDYVVDELGIAPNRLGGGGVTIMSWTAPLPNQRFDPLGNSNAMTIDSQTSTTMTTSTSSDPVVAYYVMGPQALATYSPSKNKRQPTVPAESNIRTLSKIFRSGGLSCNIISFESHTRSLSIGASLLCILIGLESCNWSLSSLASNERGVSIQLM